MRAGLLPNRVAFDHPSHDTARCGLLAGTKVPVDVIEIDLSMATWVAEDGVGNGEEGASPSRSAIADQFGQWAAGAANPKRSRNRSTPISLPFLSAMVSRPAISSSPGN